MSKTSNKLRGKNPAGRSFYIDYDYLDELNDEENEYIEQFNAEFYGAGFLINPTYIIELGKMVQISGNLNRADNRDLRKYKKVLKFYKLDSGQFSCDPEFKYSDKTLHNTPELRSKCNRSNNQNQRDVNFKSNSKGKSYLHAVWYQQFYNSLDLGIVNQTLPEDYLEIKDTIMNRDAEILFDDYDTSDIEELRKEFQNVN